MRLQIPQAVPPISLLKPAADGAGRTSANYASLRNAVKAWLVAYINQGNAATILLSPLQATALGGTGSKAISNACRIWTDLDADTAGGFTRQTDATTYTTDAATKTKIIVFEIDPDAQLDVAGGFDHIGISTGASNAGNITSAMIIIQPKYAGEASQPEYLA
jgi:hypothetical protein